MRLPGLGAAQVTAEIVGFQRAGEGLPMHPHGHPDPTTLINMGLYKPDEAWDSDEYNYIHNGIRPGSFGRDLQGVSNQIPQWFWLATGVLLAGLGIYSYRQASKKRK